MEMQKTVGMLWFDNSALPLSQKIKKAGTYYTAKYGKVVNLVHVHPTATIDDGCGDLGVTIKQTLSIMPNHIWLSNQ